MSSDPEIPKYHGDLEDYVSNLRRSVFKSQTKAAEALPVHRTTITKYEQGKLRPSVGYLACLAKHLLEKLSHEDVNSEDIQDGILREVNKAIDSWHYIYESPFKIWGELVQVAEAFIWEREGRGTPESMPNKAAPLAWSVQGILNELTSTFVGRDYVFDAISEFTMNNSKGYFLLEGGPGVGKSAILAEYVKRTGHIAHFNLQSQGVTSVRSFLENVCTQIIRRFDLPYPSISPEATQDGIFLSHILQEAVKKLSPKEKIIIVIDALDEVETQNQSTNSNILYLPKAVPDNVFFVLSSRPISFQLSTLTKLERYDLMKRKVESRQDIEAFLIEVTKRPNIQKWLDEKSVTTEDFVTTLAEKSQNNFMYLKYVVNDIELDRYKDLEIQELPDGLEKYYENHWARMGMMKSPLPVGKIKIIYILCEIRQPVSRSLISEFAGKDEVSIQEVLDEWAQFLRKQQMEQQFKYSLYHTSFRDFLHRKDIVQAAGVTIKGINKVIADNLWAEWEN